MERVWVANRLADFGDGLARGDQASLCFAQAHVFQVDHGGRVHDGLKECMQAHGREVDVAGQVVAGDGVLFVFVNVAQYGQNPTEGVEVFVGVYERCGMFHQ